MKNLKEKREKGITLIALVVTIVVLVILSTISIFAVFGENGIIAITQEAHERTRYAAAKEKVEMAKLSSIDTNGKMDREKLVEELKKVGTVEKETWQIMSTVDGYIFEIREDGNIVSPQNYKITYVLNGGVNANENPNKHSDYEEVYLYNPTKENAAFDGWYYNENFLDERITKIGMDKGDVTIYAKWAEETNVDYFTWSTSSESATVTGFSELGLSKYNAGELVDLVIPRKYNNLDVTEIGYSAFKEKDKIQKLVIQETVTGINSQAFAYCSEIEKITCPISLKMGGGGASLHVEKFEGCTGIKEVNLTKGTGIGFDYDGAYGGSRDTTPWYYSKNNAIKITLEQGITKIGNNTFYNCNGLSGDMSLPESITEIGENAFYNCSNLTGDINLPRGLTNLGSYAFYNCSGLSGDINLPEGIIKLNTATFYNCAGLTGTIKINKNQTELPRDVFYGCENITEIIIPDEVSKIELGVFYNCKKVKKLTIPISTCAVSIYSSSTGIIYQPFGNCTEIEEIYFTKGTGQGYDYVTNQAHAYWQSPWYNAQNVKKITFENGITKIGLNMFRDCKGLNCEVNLPASITEIGSYAFYNCNNLKTKIPENLTEIGEYAFYNCKNMSGIAKIPNGQESVQYSFYGCENIEEIIIPDSVTQISDGAFYNCKNVKKLTIPISLCASHEYSWSTGIIYQPFEGCNSINEVKFTKGTGEGYSYKDDDHSYDCTPWYYSRNNNLKITLDSGIESIGTYTFYGLNNINVYYNGTQEQWNKIIIGDNNTSLTNKNINFV